MSMHDPLRDPNDPLDPRGTAYRDLDTARSGPSWGWIIGGFVALMLLFVFVFGVGRDTDRTASTGTNPPITSSDNTGRSPTLTPPVTATRPAPADTTGAAPRDSAPAQ
jgi:hypothetical protein